MMETYKFRTECKQGVEELTKLIFFKIGSLDVVPIPGSPDVEATLTMNSIHLDKLKSYMRLIDVSHVMIQTLAIDHEYTGERNYDIT